MLTLLTTIYIGGILILLAVIASLTSPFLRKVSLNAEEDESSNGQNQTLPGISIIIPAHKGSTFLEDNIPYFLQQQYPAPFQVVVVAEKGDTETEDVLKRLSIHDNLYTTFLPMSSRYMSRRKLAITVGIKAAKYEWCILTEASCRPDSDFWLASMAATMHETKDIVMGYTHFPDEDVADYQHFQHFSKARLMFRSMQKGHGYGCHCTNLAFRKSVFMEGNGFLGNLQLIRGEYDFIVNKYSTEDNSALAITPPCWLTDMDISQKTWLNNQLFYQESRKYLRGSLRYRFPLLTDNLFLHTSFLVNIATITYAAIIHNWMLLGVAIAAILILMIWRTLSCSRALTKFETHIAPFKLFFFQLRSVWTNSRYAIKHHFADKYEFTSHKL
uniref:Glycosyltransferase 2-like domain-containing protein n=1 Tax=Prevotella sp. GTC17262 TaxID=3236797 RepID=A0AB33JMP5_9BACT